MLSTLESFNLDSVAPGEKRAQRLDVCELAGGDVLRLPMLVVKGASPGPTIVVLGGAATSTRGPMRCAASTGRWTPRR